VDSGGILQIQHVGMFDVREYWSIGICLSYRCKLRFNFNNVSEVFYQRGYFGSLSGDTSTQRTLTKQPQIQDQFSPS